MEHLKRIFRKIHYFCHYKLSDYDTHRTHHKHGIPLRQERGGRQAAGSRPQGLRRAGARHRQAGKLLHLASVAQGLRGRRGRQAAERPQTRGLERGRHL